MLIISRQEIGAERWNALVLDSPDGWVFSLYQWQEAILAVPRWQLEEHGFAIEHEGRLLAVVPLHYVASLRQLHSSGFGGSGAIIAPNLGRRHGEKVRSTIMRHMSELAAKIGAESLLVSLNPVTRSSLSNRWGVNPLVLQGFDDRSSHSMVVDLELSEEQLWAGLSEIARRKIKNARHAGYTTRCCNWMEMLDVYYDTHCETYHRTGVQPHPKEYFQGIASRVAPLGHSVLWVGFSPDSLPVAFHNSARFSVGGMYHTGCSRTAHMASGINYMLFWESIVDAKRNGLKYYEVGEIFPSSSSGKEYGLSMIKSKFGGEIHRYFRGEYGYVSLLNMEAETSVLSPIIPTVQKRVVEEPIFRERFRDLLLALLRFVFGRMRGDKVWVRLRKYVG